MKPSLSSDNQDSDSDPNGQSTAETTKREFSLGDGRFRLAFEKAPIGLAIVDLDYQLLRLNKSLCDALGYEEAELLGKRFIDITHPDDGQRDLALADQLYRGEISNYRVEKRFLKKQGDLAWLDFSAVVIRSAEEEPLYCLVMVENITDRRRTLDALRTSEERYRSFVVNSSEGIWRLEIEQPIDITLPPDEQISLFYKYGYLGECNDTLARMHGHDRADDLVGSRFGELALAKHPTSVSTLRKLIANSYRLMNLETEKFDEKGVKKYFSSNLIGIVINNQLLRIWGVQRDRTEQRTVELNLEHSQQELRSLSAYLQSVRERERTDLAREIHDTLGQALTGIRIEISQLNKHLKNGKETSLDAISKQLEEINLVVTESISSVQALATELRPGVLDKFGLSAAIEWQCEEFARRYGIQAMCNVPSIEMQLQDELSTALFRILQEALINVARHSEANEVRVDLLHNDADVSLVIDDNGKGITVDELHAPTSLGLLGMRERAEGLRGNLTIERKSDGGTIVKVCAPISPKQTSETSHD